MSNDEDIFSNRRSVRVFKKKTIDEGLIQKVLEAANLAPSAGNLQGYEIVLVKDSTRKAELSEAALGQGFVKDAPVVLVFCANSESSARRYSSRGAKLYAVQDATISCAYAHLAASRLGLGSCWVGAFDEEMVKETINCPEGVRPVAILPIGYPDENPKPRPRRELADIVHDEQY